MQQSYEMGAEWIVVDSDPISNMVMQYAIDLANVPYHKILFFEEATAALDYLKSAKSSAPKIILLEILDKNKHLDFNFLDHYPLLNRTDLIYVVSISCFQFCMDQCLAYDFIRKYLLKPIDGNLFATIHQDYTAWLLKYKQRLAV